LPPIHGPRDIDGEDELDIDRQVVAVGQSAVVRSQGQGKRGKATNDRDSHNHTRHRSTTPSERALGIGILDQVRMKWQRDPDWWSGRAPRCRTVTGFPYRKPIPA